MTQKKRTPKKMPGQPSAFRGKVRKPVTLTLTPAHRSKVEATQKRLRKAYGIPRTDKRPTRADVFACLVEQFADQVTLSEENLLNMGLRREPSAA